MRAFGVLFRHGRARSQYHQSSSAAQPSPVVGSNPPKSVTWNSATVTSTRTFLIEPATAATWSVMTIPPLLESPPTKGIAQIPIWVQTHPVTYRGIRYTIRARIERGQWSVAIYPSGVEVAAKFITGTREYATLKARSMIDEWIKMHPAQKH
jgi:hypothetical protein